jgi:hypothetical protein
MELTQRDLLAKTLQAEAGNQGYNGMVAVGSVIMNRLAGGSDLGKVILKPGQFSAWNSVTGYAGGEQGQDMDFTPSARSYEVADALLSGNYEDPTGGATHYYNPQISDPTWGQSGGGDWQTIGQHVFGKANMAGPKPIPNNGTMTESLEAKIFGGASAMDGQSTGRNMQQPSAIQMQKMQQQQGSGGLMGFLRDPRTREAFASMDVSGRLGGIQQRASADVERMNVREKDNRTAEWLSTQPGGQKYADAIRIGSLSGSEAYSQYISDTQSKGVKVGEKLVDPVTGKVIYEDTDAAGVLDKDKLTMLNSVNDDLRARVKPFEEVRDGFERIKTFFQNPSGVSDYALAVAFAKILDPGSVAREGEVAAVANAGGGLQSLVEASVNFMLGEGSLPEPVRRNIMNLSNQSYRQQAEIAKRVIADAETILDGAGIDKKFMYKISIPPAPELVIPQESPESGAQPNGIITKSALDAGLTQEIWNQMTPDEIATYP